ncbi:MAG: hypothetical protein L0G36_01250, partial [Brevibacterium sp.]|nr:hypothetical protein [Brevibacterium sp.]
MQFWVIAAFRLHLTTDTPTLVLRKIWLIHQSLPMQKLTETITPAGGAEDPEVTTPPGGWGGVSS